MTASKIISLFGITLLFMYASSKIMDFYGIGSSAYGSYFAFYLFLLLSYFILPTKYSQIPV
jgi:hypothetical protein